MRLELAPDGVSSIGDKAHGIGEDIAAAHRHVGDAWSDAAGAGIEGLATHAALDAYTERFEHAITKLGTRVHGRGSDLKGTAGTTAGHDAAGGEHLHAAAQRCVARIHTVTFDG